MGSILEGSRSRANALLTADRADRHSLDTAALNLLGRTVQTETAARKRAADQQLEADRLADSLAGSLLSDAEIEAIVAARQSDITPLAAGFTAAAAAAGIKVEALKKFVDDPLRKRDLLGTDLLAELTNLAAALVDQRFDPTAEKERLRLEFLAGLGRPPARFLATKAARSW